MSNRGSWVPHATMEDYRQGLTRIFRPYEDLIVSATLDETVSWPVMQEAERQGQHYTFMIPLGEIIGPEVPYDDILGFMESVSEGFLGQYPNEGTLEILSPRLFYPEVTTPPIARPSLPPHIVQILLEKAEAEETLCPITASPITVASGVVTSCGHIFDREGIETWFEQADTCPDCRSPCRI
jgi:hypothetical protein